MRSKLVAVVCVVLAAGCSAQDPGTSTAPEPVRPSATTGPTTPEPTAAGEAVPPTTPAPSPPPAAPVPAPPPAVPDSGPGTFAVAAGTMPVVGSGALVRYTVEVETGLPFDPAGTAAAVDTTLADPRSWIGDGRTAFQRVDAGGDVRVLVASPATTDQLCAPLRTRGEVSCRNGSLVVLNGKRWALGIDAYAGALDEYRRYLVNHEVGHAIGQDHRPCPGPGQLAPVMQQQTYGLDGCLPNPWPFPG